MTLRLCRAWQEPGSSACRALTGSGRLREEDLVLDLQPEADLQVVRVLQMRLVELPQGPPAALDVVALGELGKGVAVLDLDVLGTAGRRDPGGLRGLLRGRLVRP